MCKDHDQLHYQANMRKMAACAALANPTARDELLKAFALHGAVEFLERHGDYLTAERLATCKMLIGAERDRLKPGWDLMIERLMNDWQEEAQALIDALPY